MGTSAHGSSSARPARAGTRRLFISVLWALTVAVVLLGGGAFARREVSLSVDGVLTGISTSASTVAGALETAGFSLGPRDGVRPTLASDIAADMVIEVRRAKAFSLFVNGRLLRLATSAPTVGEALAGLRVAIRPEDRIDPPPETPVVEGLRVTVTRVVRSYRHQQDPIPFSVNIREDMSMMLGHEVVERPGQPGLVHRLLLLTYEDGSLTEVEELARTVMTEPVTKIARVGTAGTIVRDGRTISFLKRMEVTATAYEPGPISCGAYADGYTALGVRATRGIIAVDPAVIPFWTKVYIDGYGFAVAADRGSAIRGHRVDLCYDTYAEAMAWGVRRVRLYILELPGS